MCDIIPTRTSVKGSVLEIDAKDLIGKQVWISFKDLTLSVLVDAKDTQIQVSQHGYLDKYGFVLNRNGKAATPK